MFKDLFRSATTERPPLYSPPYRSVMAVVVSCSRDEISGWVTCQCARLYGTDYEYHPEPGDADSFEAHAGIDPGIVDDCLVKLSHIEPIPNSPDIEWWAEPQFSYPPQTFDIPSPNCTTEFTEPCNDGYPVTLCTG